MSFAFSKAVDSSKVFIEQKSNVTGRWDPFYFLPELVALEKLVRNVASHRLRDFVISMAGGATPSTRDSETHYAENGEGVPFIRVQNLSTTGRLNLSDCKRIRRNTHEGLLKRSQLGGGELLVKITGVGRMAVASVVPDGFEGNINQHIVAIRTKDRHTSETLAAYLNLDIVERLASRRSTGGTRPALDYPALLSIPIVFDERIPELMGIAVDRYQSRIDEATSLLASIDDVLLEELGIPVVPEPPDALEKRMFHLAFSDLTGTRFDPIAHQEKRRALERAIHASKFPIFDLRNLVKIFKIKVKEIEEGLTYVGLENINGTSGEYIAISEKESVGTATQFRSGQILFPKLRPYLNKTHLASFNGICSTEFHVFEPEGATGEYLTAFLRSRAIVGITSLLMTGNTLPRLQMSDIERLPIPVPSRDLQRDICVEILKLRSKALAQREKARRDLEKAKRDIEVLILGKEPVT